MEYFASHSAIQADRMQLLSEDNKPHGPAEYICSVDGLAGHFRLSETAFRALFSREQASRLEPPPEKKVSGKRVASPSRITPPHKKKSGAGELPKLTNLVLDAVKDAPRTTAEIADWVLRFRQDSTKGSAAQAVYAAGKDGLIVKRQEAGTNLDKWYMAKTHGSPRSDQ